MKLLLLLAPLLFAGTTKPEPLAGSWAGDGIALEISPEEIRVEYDCAHGTIDGAIVPDRRGRFTLGGTHGQEHGGPVRQREDRAAGRARYVGRVRGTTMTLTVTADGEKIGTFTLEKGREPSLVKCR